MVRTYKRKTQRGSFGEDNLSAALKAIVEGMPLIRASRNFNVPARTLRRHRDKKVAQPGVLKLGRFRSALPFELEEELKIHVLDMQRRMYGLRMRDLQRLAYDIAEKVKINHPFNKTTKMAGKHWVNNFLNRHNLTLRQPQATSISRMVGFNRPQVELFFDLLKERYTCNNYTPSSVWNMDETGLTTVQRPGKVVARKGARQVSKATSAERGTLVTMICAFNAAGAFLPPMYIFPRKRMVDTLLNGAPPQSVGFANPSGWTDTNLFVHWLRHFASIISCSTENPQIILLDGHHSHKSLEAIEFCRDNGIEMISFPPHSTHKLQPLDRTYFKALKSAFNAEADGWMVTHPGQRITVYRIAELSGKAFLRKALPEKAVNGFKVCGVWPFDPNVFTDTDFEGAAATDEPMNGEAANSVDQPFAGTTMQSQENNPGEAASSDNQPFAGTPVQQENNPPEENYSASNDMTPMTVIQTSGDGRCLFRSLVTGLDPRFQTADRDEHGVLTDPVLSLRKQSQADGHRANVVDFMCCNYNDYTDLPTEAISADLPPHVHYCSVQDRISAIAEPLSLPGELEIAAASKVLHRQIIVINSHNAVVQRYGDDNADPLVVQFLSVGQDVGHYNYVLNWIGDDFARPQRPDTQSARNIDSQEQQSNTEEPCASTLGIRRTIDELSPFPKRRFKRPRSRKAESAAVLNSSPFKAKVANKQAKNKRKTVGKQKAKLQSQKGKKRTQEAECKSSDEEEECPCLICCESYSQARPREVWVQCQVCHNWAHEECTPGMPQFICPNCDSDS